MSKVSMSIKIKCESHVDNFLQYWRNCFSWVCALRHHCEHRILQRSVRTPTKWYVMKTARKVKNRFALHHDNAPCHTSLMICQFLADNKITMCPHPTHLPDLPPCDFWLFQKIKLTMKGNRFDMISETEAASKQHLKALMKDDFQGCFRSLQDHWNKCTESKEYVEGDYLHF